MNSKIDNYKSEKILSDTKCKKITNSENKNLLINKCRNLPNKKLYERTKTPNTQNPPDFSNDSNKNKVFETEANNDQKNLKIKKIELNTILPKKNINTFQNKNTTPKQIIEDNNFQDTKSEQIYLNKIFLANPDKENNNLSIQK